MFLKIITHLINLLVISLYAFICFPAISFAGPSITSLSDSSPQNEQTITISGTDFGSGPTIVIYDRYDDESSTSDKSASEVGTWCSTKSPTITSESARYPGDKAFLFCDSGRIKGMVGTFDGSMEVFVSYRAIIPKGYTFPGVATVETYPAPGQSVWKQAWINDGNGCNFVNYDDDLCIGTWTPSYRIAGNDFNSSLSKSHSESFAFDVWNTNIIHLKVIDGGWDTGSAGYGPAFWESISIKNGSNVTSNNYTMLMDEDTCADCNPRKQWDRIGMGSWVRNNSDSINSRILYDDAYIAAGKNARAHIEVRDTAIFENATKTVIAYPKSWSSTSIEVKLFRDYLPRTSYLYVIDSEGNVSNPKKIDWAGGQSELTIPPSPKSAWVN